MGISYPSIPCPNPPFKTSTLSAFSFASSNLKTFSLFSIQARHEFFFFFLFFFFINLVALTYLNYFILLFVAAAIPSAFLYPFDFRLEHHIDIIPSRHELNFPKSVSHQDPFNKSRIPLFVPRLIFSIFSLLF